MVIYNAQWRAEFHRIVLPRLAAAHPDLSRIATILRDTQGAEVWTETPSDSAKVSAGKTPYSMEGWRVHYSGELARLSAWSQQYRTLLQGYDPQAVTALDGYLSSIPTIGAVFSTIMASYRDGQGRLIQTPVSQTDRETLAAAIEAELQ